MPIRRETVSIVQAGAAVGVSRRTIYNWLKAGKLQYTRTASGAVRIFADSLWRDAISHVHAAGTPWVARRKAAQ